MGLTGSTNPRIVAFLFPGQGSQVVGMGKDLAANYPLARMTFEEADAALEYKLSQLCFDGPEDRLKLTEITQPAILTVSIAALRVLKDRGLQPEYLAGHSLGEYTAHVAAGTISFAEAVRTVRNRGRYMQSAVPAGVGAMAAILGMKIDELDGVCREASTDAEIVTPANINSPDQIVISGHAPAVQRAADLAKARGAKRAIMLQVSAPFHSPLMQPAQEALEQDLNQLLFRNSSVPVAKNIDGELTQAADKSRHALVRQVTGAVQWVKCVETLIGNGVTHFVEVGPSKVLCGLMRQIDRSQTCMNVEDGASVEKTLAAFSS
ncbi:MAG TPA: ACP S-malonyltransferase [Candidatus Eremiobacteraceae bacterium]|nr:ACP S-malonyltransferase [Candidatus Eremiobacteraceae bacterium]